MNYEHSRFRAVILLFTVISVGALPSFAANAKKGFLKATVGRSSLKSSSPDRPAAELLAGLDGKILEEYDDITLVEISENDKDKLKQRGNAQYVLVRLRDEFDKIHLSGKVLDAREDKEKPPPGEKHDPPYKNDEQGTWIIQFIGPVKTAWIERIKAEGIVPVQPVSMNAYIVGGRESAIKNVENLPFIQYRMQMHRFLKPSVGQLAEESVELWIELAETVETDDSVALLEKLSLGPIESARWSETERRVQGIFAMSALDVILAQPLVIGIAERPKIGLSDERAVLGLTTLVPSTGSPAPEAGKYKKWLSDLCAACSNLQGDGFYIGIADTGLDGGDRVASGDGSIPGEVGSSNLHRDELAASRIVWGQSFAPTKDTTNSKHDTVGHGTLVAGIAAGNPLPTGGKDADGFFWGLGVAPSAGLAITKIDTPNIATGATPVADVTRDARTSMSPRAY